MTKAINCKASLSWGVPHAFRNCYNVHEERLQKVRDKYLARDGIREFINIGNSDEIPDPARAKYYGMPSESLIRQIQIGFGKSILGSYWRFIKGLSGK